MAMLSDASEAAALTRVFGASMPPVTAFKWATGHPLAASGAPRAASGATYDAGNRGSGAVACLELAA